MTDYLGLFKIILVSFIATVLTDATYIGAPGLSVLYLAAPLESMGTVSVAAINTCFLNLAESGRTSQVQAMFTQLLGLSAGIGPMLYAFVMVYAENADSLKHNV